MEAESKTTPMPESRIRHIIGVARRAVRVGELMGYDTDEDRKRFFLMGWLHDIGYEFMAEEDTRGHEAIGGEMLRNSGYRDWRLIAEHGSLDPTEESTELDILNAADMLTDGYGNAVTFDERLEDIACRYGRQSEPYLNSVMTVARLRERGYDVASDDVLRERKY
jgi:hypothetical protein